MQTEHATDDRDLPHVSVGNGRDCEFCGRNADNTIHKLRAETAAHVEPPPLVTEKGS